MRNPERIPKVLKCIEEAWIKNPDLRFSQLVLNLFGCPDYPVGPEYYYLEDDKFVKLLEYRYGKCKYER